ncbi:hypothetical protein GCM10027280_62250 [Micromonospora polyrhachis]|uniref:WXG100 family type VII secretion target n=1 Tax=Micromonospora polyrhachis TaxID=1282883 RepID=A0A7W7SSH0_9ACTN|nr:hypothetical protein [Micromonospora polyrhachis]MBB4958875.1 hypothetical protein [Micromonospora polyrhachis]
MGSDFSSNAPAVYHDATVQIFMDPGKVHDIAHGDLLHYLGMIKDSWKKIADTLEDLKLGWAGESAEAAQAFSERLINVQADVFGVSEEEGDRAKAGILDLLRYGAVHAAANFGAAEGNATEYLNKFAAALEEKVEEGEDVPQPESNPNGPVSIEYGTALVKPPSD